MKLTWKMTMLVLGVAFILHANGPEKRVALMYGSDVIASPRGPVILSVAVEAASNGEAPGRPLVGETVEFLLQVLGGRTLDRPVLLGTAETDAGGHASMEWTPDASFTEKTGGVELVARLARGSIFAGLAPVRIVLPAADRLIMLVRLDVESSSASDVSGAAEEATGVSGARILRELSERYQLVYLTSVQARAVPAFRAWMQRRNLPPGPLLLLDEGAEAPRAPQEILANRIGELVRSYPGIAVGLGATEAEARAFTTNGLAAVIVPRDPTSIDGLPDGTLATSSWREVYAHLRLCEASRDLLTRLDSEGDEAREAQRLLDHLGTQGLPCVDRWRADPELRSAAVYVSGRLRAIDGFFSAIDRTTPDTLLDSLMAAWRFGETSVIGRLYVDPVKGEAEPIPSFARWSSVGPPRELDASTVQQRVRLTGEDGSISTREIVCVRQPDSTWRIESADPAEAGIR